MYVQNRDIRYSKILVLSHVKAPTYLFNSLVAIYFPYHHYSHMKFC